jgi:hypothetical protein
MSEGLESGAVASEASGDFSESVNEEGQDLSTEQSLEASEESGELPAGSEVENIQEAVAEAVEKGATQKEIKNMIREYKLKVNGKDVSAKLDLNDEEAVKRELQKAYAFNDVSQEYSSVKKALQERIELWKQNPEQALMDIGVDPKEWAEKVIQEEVENLKKDPKELELEKAQKRIQEFETREAKIKEQMESQRQAQMDQEALSTLKQEVQDAISKHEFIKPNEYTERRVVDMMAYYSEKFPDVTAEQVLPAVEQEIKKEFNTLLNSLPEDYLERFFEKDIIEKLSKRLTRPVSKPVAKKTTPVTPSQVKVPTAQGVKPAEMGKKLTFEEIMAKR